MASSFFQRMFSFFGSNTKPGPTSKKENGGQPTDNSCRQVKNNLKTSQQSFKKTSAAPKSSGHPKDNSWRLIKSNLKTAQQSSKNTSAPPKSSGHPKDNSWRLIKSNLKTAQQSSKNTSAPPKSSGHPKDNSWRQIKSNLKTAQQSSKNTSAPPKSSGHPKDNSWRQIKNNLKTAQQSSKNTSAVPKSSGQPTDSSCRQVNSNPKTSRQSSKKMSAAPKSSGQPTDNSCRQVKNNPKTSQQSSKKTSAAQKSSGQPTDNSCRQVKNNPKTSQQSSKKTSAAPKSNYKKKKRAMEFIKMYERDGFFLARMDVAAFEPSDIEMQYNGDTLLITLQKNVNDLWQSTYTRKSCVRLPPGVLLEDIAAIYIHGMLTIIVERPSRKFMCGTQALAVLPKIYEEEGVFVARINMNGYPESSITMLHKPGSILVNAKRVFSNGQVANISNVKFSIPLPPEIQTEDSTYIVVNDTMTIVAEFP